MIAEVSPAPPHRWFYSRDGRQFGPTDLAGLNEMAAHRHLTPECDAWEEGVSQPAPAATLPGLSFPAKPVSTSPDLRYAGLYRSTDERLVLGFCGGFAHKLGLPVWVVRGVVLASMGLMVGWAYVFALLLPALPTAGVQRPPEPLGGIAPTP